MYGIFLKGNQFSILVKLHFNLLVDNKDIMHFCIKLRIPSFAVIGHLKRFDPCIAQNFPKRCFSYCCHTRMSFRFCYRVDEFPETHGIPEFSRIAVILRFLAGFTDYPGDIVIGDFRFSSTAFVIT